MIKKYNLALLPISKSDEVISLANKFSHLAFNYLLGKNSLPHVTLYQFHTEESDIHSIWKKVYHGWKYESLELIFNEFSCITFNDYIYWVSLLPNNQGVLHEMHKYIADAISFPVKSSFDPHMTLINTKNNEYEKEVIKISGSYHPFSDKFILSIGLADDVGQFIKMKNRVTDER